METDIGRIRKLVPPSSPEEKKILLGAGREFPGFPPTLPWSSASQPIEGPAVFFKADRILRVFPLRPAVHILFDLQDTTRIG